MKLSSFEYRTVQRLVVLTLVFMPACASHDVQYPRPQNSSHLQIHELRNPTKQGTMNVVYRSEKVGSTSSPLRNQKGAAVSFLSGDDYLFHVFWSPNTRYNAVFIPAQHDLGFYIYWVNKQEHCILTKSEIYSLSDIFAKLLPEKYSLLFKSLSSNFDIKDAKWISNNEFRFTAEMTLGVDSVRVPPEVLTEALANSVDKNNPTYTALLRVSVIVGNKQNIEIVKVSL